MDFDFPEKQQINSRLELPMHIRWKLSTLENYTEDKYLYGREWYRNQLSSLGIEINGPVLDAGCGPGQWAIVMAEANSEFPVVAFDTNKELLSAANFQKSKLGLENLQIKQGEIYKLPFEDESFSLTCCIGVLQLVRVREAFSELVRVTKPGGQILINVSGLGFYLTNIIGSAKSCKKEIMRQNYRFIKNTLRGGNNDPFTYFTKSRIERIGKEFNLRVRSIEATGLYPPQKKTFLGAGVNWYATFFK